jgi:hypothetical protein
MRPGGDEDALRLPIRRSNVPVMLLEFSSIELSIEPVVLGEVGDSSGRDADIVPPLVPPDLGVSLFRQVVEYFVRHVGVRSNGVQDLLLGHAAVVVQEPLSRTSDQVRLAEIQIQFAKQSSEGDVRVDAIPSIVAFRQGDPGVGGGCRYMASPLGGDR